MRIANVPRERRTIFQHNDVADLAKHLAAVPEGIDRVVVIFDGIFSMRGDNAPLGEFEALVREHHPRFPQGVISVMDDSHGIGAYGATGRGTEEHCKARADVMVGTFGKAFGVNGGFIAGIRPGQRTAEYLDFVLTRLTVVGAAYLAAVCLLPEILISNYSVPFYFGGTSLLIVVSVTMDTVTQVQSHLLAHQYEGLIKKSKLRGRKK